MVFLCSFSRNLSNEQEEGLGAFLGLVGNELTLQLLDGRENLRVKRMGFVTFMATFSVAGFRSDDRRGKSTEWSKTRMTMKQLGSTWTFETYRSRGAQRPIIRLLPKDCWEEEQKVQQVPLVLHLLGVKMVSMLSIPQGSGECVILKALERHFFAEDGEKLGDDGSA